MSTAAPTTTSPRRRRPPDDGSAGQLGFTFNRSGVRIPTLAISAWIPERTVDHRRVPRHLAAGHDARALEPRRAVHRPRRQRRSFKNIFTLSSPRPQEDWPEITPRPVPVMHESIAPLDAPLGLLGKSFLFGILTLAKDLGKPLPKDLPDPKATITGAQALALVHEILGDLFPNMRDKATLS